MVSIEIWRRARPAGAKDFVTATPDVTDIVLRTRPPTDRIDGSAFRADQGERHIASLDGQEQQSFELVAALRTSVTTPPQEKAALSGVALRNAAGR